MSFPGTEDLRAYVKDSDYPSFKAFVGANSSNIARWSVGYDMTGSELFAMWRCRFALSLREYHKTDCILSSKTYDAKTWQLIEKMSIILSEASLVTRIEMLQTMIAAAPSASNDLKELLSIQEDEQAQQEVQHEVQQQEHQQTRQKQTPEDHRFQDLNKEGRMYLLGHKKFSGMELTDDEKFYLQSITNDGTLKSCIQYLAARSLLLEKLDTTDLAIAKLGISKIVDAINPTIRKRICDNLNDDAKQSFLLKNGETPFTSLEPDVCAVIDSLINDDETGGPKLYSMEDLDELLERIQTKKAECSKNKQRCTQLYQSLSCMEQIVESFDLWDDDDKTSEITYYRRFASILDIIFRKTDIKLHDGETGSASTKLEREINKAIFHSMDVSPTYSRKIDLLLKCKEAKTAIEMSSNEWKRACVTKDIQLAQQCKNLRVNTSILKNLTKLGVNRTMSMDWIGNSGYIYKLQWLPDEEVYFASNCAVIHLPTSPLLLFDVKPTLESLFKLKLSLLHDAKIVKTALQIKKRTKRIQGLVDTSSASIAEASTASISPLAEQFSPPLPVSASISPSTTSLYSSESSIETHLHESFVFFTPKNSRFKRMRLLTEDEEDVLGDFDNDTISDM